MYVEQAQLGTTDRRARIEVANLVVAEPEAGVAGGVTALDVPQEQACGGRGRPLRVHFVADVVDRIWGRFPICQRRAGGDRDGDDGGNYGENTPEQMPAVARPNGRTDCGHVAPAAS